MSAIEWRQLRQGQGAEAIVVVDFGINRQAAFFAELIAQIDTGRHVLQPLVHTAGDEMLRRTADEHVASWISELSARGLRVSGILGYCAGSTLAAILARSLAGKRTPAPTVLLDPTNVNPEDLYETFDLAVARFEGVVGADAQGYIAEVRDQRADGIARFAREPIAVTDALCHAYDQVVRVVGTELRMSDDMPRQLSAYFRSYLNYLTLTSVARLPARPEPATTVLTSTDHILPAGWSATRTFPVARDNLLSTREVVVGVTEILFKIGQS
ncbi:hypothetical protein [Streptomyces diastaticus]|uniref:hypothetical protein n=1 Tax=Streptomyces diastaticus TaxID=1956 RepID=UPI003668DA68